MVIDDLPPWPRYRPIRIIGQGGFGTVYLCEDTEPTSALYQQEVAIKAISLTALSDEEALMVMSEVSLLKNIDHPNIIKYYDSFLYEEEEEDTSVGNVRSTGDAVGTAAARTGGGSPRSNQTDAQQHHKMMNRNSSSSGGEEREMRRAAPAATTTATSGTPGIVAQWLCLVTEYMDGGDLSSLLRQYTHPAKAPAKHSDDDGGDGGSLENGCEASHSLPSAAASTTTPQSPSPHLLEGPFSEEMFQWGDTDSVDATAKAEMPLSAQQHKRVRSAEARRYNAKVNGQEKSKAVKKEGIDGRRYNDGGAGANTGDDDLIDNWERRSSQHRRRLASTLRLATHPFQSSLLASDVKDSVAGAAAVVPRPFGVASTTSATDMEILVSADEQDAAADRAALDTWISDTSEAIMPATPLGATELGDAAQHGQSTDPLHRSPFASLTTANEQDKSDFASGKTTVTGITTTTSEALSSPTSLEAQLPPNPNQLWVESFLITDIAKQCLDALAYLHALGILHRDIKPSNIYLSKRDGTVKIGDFGVSKLLQPSAPFTTTFVGTPFYLCPELCMGDPYSYGADIWALGVLLYELYCLKLPFSADNVLGQIYVITEGTYDKAALRRPHAFAEAQRTILENLYGPSFAQSEVLLHGLVVEMVEKMLCVDPAQRPSAEALLTRVFGGSAAVSRVGSSAGTSALQFSVAPTPKHRPPSASLVQPLPPPQQQAEKGGSLVSSNGEENVSKKYKDDKSSSKEGARAGASTAASASPVKDSTRSAGDGGNGATTCGAANVASARLGPAAAEEHARWAGSLVQAASAARATTSSESYNTNNVFTSNTSPGYDNNALTAATTPPGLWSSSASPLPSAPQAKRGNPITEAEHEPLAIKVKLNMLDILQEMPYEQRERLESRAAEEDAYDAQRLKNAAVLSSISTTAAASSSSSTSAMRAVKTATGEQMQLSSQGSFGEVGAMLALPPPALSPSRQLYNNSRKTGDQPMQASPKGTTRASSMQQQQLTDAEARVTFTAPLFSSLSQDAMRTATSAAEGDKREEVDAEDSLDRLIGAGTRDELGAFLDEVPWLQNADVFSAIPLSAGSDDVMFVARAGHTKSHVQQQPQQHQRRRSGSYNNSNSSSGVGAGLTNRGKAEEASTTYSSNNSNSDNISNTYPLSLSTSHSPEAAAGSAGGECPHPPAPAVRYAGSVSRTNPNIEVTDMPQHHQQQRQRTSIAGIAPVEVNRIAGRQTPEPQQLSEQWQAVDSVMQRSSEEEDDESTQEQQRRISHGASATSDYFIRSTSSPPPPPLLCQGRPHLATEDDSANTAPANHNKKSFTARHLRGSGTGVAATAAIVAPPRSGDRSGSTSPLLEGPTNEANNARVGAAQGVERERSQGTCDQGAEREATHKATTDNSAGVDAEEAPAAVTVVSSRGGGGALHSRLSSTRLQREEGSAAVGARLRPVSAKAKANGAAEATNPTSTTNSGAFLAPAAAAPAAAAGAVVGGNVNCGADAAAADAATLSLEELNKREGLDDFPVAPLSAELTSPPTPLKHDSAHPPNHQKEVGGAPPLPPTPKVRVAGRCEGFTTSELEGLLRAKLLAHYKKRQQLLRAQRAELAAQEAARAKMREKLGALFAANYNASASSATPDSIRETASYHSTRTYDTMLSTDDDGFTLSDKPRALARVATASPVPDDTPPNATLLSTQLPSPPSMYQQQQQQELDTSHSQARRSPKLILHPHPASARTPATAAATSAPAGASVSASSPIVYGSPNASSLDQTARQAHKEEEVLRSLSARHVSDTVNSPLQLHRAQTKSASPNTMATISKGTGAQPKENSLVGTTVKDTTSTPPSSNAVVAPPPLTPAASTTPPVPEADLLLKTAAVRQLRHAAALAAAVARQKAAFHQNADGPSRIVVAPPWRPPHASANVPSLWETSSAEEEADGDARGRPGRPAPAHLREELRWRWSAPPSDDDDDSDDEGGDEGSSTTEDVNETGSNASSSGSNSNSGGEQRAEGEKEASYSTKAATPSGGVTIKGGTASGKRKKNSATPRSAGVVEGGTTGDEEAAAAEVHIGSDHDEGEGVEEDGYAYGDKDGQLRRQSSLLGSPMELLAKKDTNKGFPLQPVSRKSDKPSHAGSPPSVPQRGRSQRGRAGGETGSDSRSNSSNSNSNSKSNSKSLSTQVSGPRRARRTTLQPLPPHTTKKAGNGLTSKLKKKKPKKSVAHSDSTGSTTTSAATSRSTSSNRTPKAGSNDRSSSAGTHTDTTTTDSSEDEDGEEEEEEEDMSYTYAVQLDAETGRRFFDYVCPVTVEVVAELPPRCRVASSAQIWAELRTLSPSGTKWASAFSSTGLTDFVLASPSPPPRAGAVAAPSPTEREADAAKAVARAAEGDAVKNSLEPANAAVTEDAGDAAVHSSLESSGKSSLFEDCSLLLPPSSPTPPPNVITSAPSGDAVPQKSGSAEDGIKNGSSSSGANVKAPDATLVSASAGAGMELLSMDIASPATPLHRSASYTGEDAARASPKKGAKGKDKDGSVDSPPSQRRIDSMFILGTKAPTNTNATASSAPLSQPKPNTTAEKALTPKASSPPPPLLTEEEEKRAVGESARRRTSAKRRAHPRPHSKHHRRSSLSATFESTMSGSGTYSTWRIRVPPPLLPVEAPKDTASITALVSAPATTSAAPQYIHLPLSLALRPMRARTRFVGLLWRLWVATQLADPALQRVLLGSARCRRGACTFAEAFGDWVRPSDSDDDTDDEDGSRTVGSSSGTTSLTATTRTTTTTTNTTSQEASISASASLTAEAASLLKLSALANKRHINSSSSASRLELLMGTHSGNGVLSSAAVGKAEDIQRLVKHATEPSPSTAVPLSASTAAGVEAAAGPQERWTLYYVEPHLNVAMKLQSDADWALVRLKVCEMGQLLPFIRLYLVLHGAELTPAC